MDSTRRAPPTRSARAGDDAVVQEERALPPPVPMKLFLQTVIVFLGTLLAAALVAVGEPGDAAVQMAVQSPPPELVAGLFGLSL
jgi:hypothetical protein